MLYAIGHANQEKYPSLATGTIQASLSYGGRMSRIRALERSRAQRGTEIDFQRLAADRFPPQVQIKSDAARKYRHAEPLGDRQ
jgi:hypothetical protein